MTFWNAVLSGIQHGILFNLTRFAVGWIAWRLWHFTICPKIYPTAPKNLPYLVPSVGHLYDFFTRFSELLQSGRRMFPSKEPFALTLASDLVYIVHSPQDVAFMYRNTDLTTFDRSVHEMYKFMAVSEPSIADTISTKARASYLGAQKAQTLTDAITELHHLQLLPGDKLEELLHARMLPQILEAVHEMAPASYVGNGWESASLYDLCSDAFARGTVTAFLGEAVWAVDQRVLEYYFDWEEKSWKFWYKRPANASGDLVRARDNFVGVIERYVALPAADRADASFFAKEIEAVLRRAEYNERDIASVMMIQLWGTLTNVYKSAFWMLAQLLHDRDTLAAVRSETLPYAENRIDPGKPDVSALDTTCPLLESVLTETLRIYVSSAFVREISEDISVSGRLLKKGGIVMVPFWMLHTDPDIWGPDAADFDAARFVKNPKMLNSPSLQPWGVDATMCPGRMLSRRVIFGYVAVLLANFDVELDGGEQAFPRKDLSKPVPGAVPWMKGDDVKVRLKPRKQGRA